MGENCTTKGKQKSELIVSGREDGLGLTRVIPAQVPVRATLVTIRLHLPVSHTFSVFDSVSLAQTLPKFRSPLVVATGIGTFPETFSVIAGVVGSSLFTAIVADFGPVLVGWNRIGTSSELPPAIFTGNDTAATINSAEDEEIPVTERLHPPLF